VSADAGPLARNPRGRRLRGLVPRGAPAPGRDAIEPLVRAHRAAHPRADLVMLRRAYDVAEELHRWQRRHSGEPFITHPLAVAAILAELGVDTTTLVAALLHDTVEDTVYTLERARAEFGEEVAHLVDGVTKLDKLRFGEAAEAETIRKLILAMARDLRVLVIKLADRVHNMRTLGFQPRHKQERIAMATLDVLVPLADRLGIQVFKRELEDLAFATLQPAAYEATTLLVRERAAQREAYLREVIGHVVPALREAGIKAIMSARPSTCAPSIRRCSSAVAAPPTSTTSPACSSWSAATPPRATWPWARCTDAGSRCSGASRTSSRCPSSTSTSRCTPP